MNTKDLDQILERHSGLVDREYPFECRSCHMMNNPTKPVGYEAKDEAGQMFVDGMEFLEKGQIDTGRWLLEEAFLAGNLEAGNALALGFSYGWFGRRDEDTATKLFRKLSYKGERNAMNNYAYAYLHGLGVKKNLYRAEYWLIKAIENGNLCAAASFGQLIIEHVFPKRSMNLAMWLLFWAADNGVSGAMNDIGLCYEEGTLVRRDYEKAFKWYKKAVDYGAGACAEMNLSRCYREGFGVKKNEDRAQAWENLAVEHGFDLEAYYAAYDI